MGGGGGGIPIVRGGGGGGGVMLASWWSHGVPGQKTCRHSRICHNITHEFD